MNITKYIEIFTKSKKNIKDATISRKVQTVRKF